jgi:hypothetical protein
VEKFKSSELLVTYNASATCFVDKVYITTGQTFFFKPRLGRMVPEFKRYLSVFNILDRGLHKTLKITQLAGLEVLDNGVVAGVFFEWSTRILMFEL